MKTNASADNKSDEETTRTRGRGRPSGLVVQDKRLKAWADRHFLGDGSVIAALAERLSVGESTVSRYLNGVSGIDDESWRKAIQEMIEAGDFNHDALLEFDSLCTAAKGETRAAVQFGIARHFEPIQARLAGRLEQGRSAAETLCQAFAEAGGLVSAWLLQERRFGLEQFKAGVSSVVEMTNRWMLVVEYLDESAPFSATESAFFDEYSKREGAKFAAQAAKATFLHRLASWVKTAAPAPQAQIPKLLEPIRKQLWLDGQPAGEE